MAPFYKEVCQELSWPIDEALLSKMETRNQEQLRELDAAIEDAEQNLGEMEVREANLKKSEHLCRIGDKEGAVSAFRKTYDKTVSLGHRLDIVFHNIRIGLFYMDHDLVTRNIEKAKRLFSIFAFHLTFNLLYSYQILGVKYLQLSILCTKLTK